MPGSVQRPLKDPGGSRAVNHLGAPFAVEIQFVDQEAFDGGRGKPLILKGDVESAQSLQIAGKGSAGLGSWSLGPIHIERQPYDHGGNIPFIDQFEEAIGLKRELRLANEFQWARDHSMGIGNSDADCLFAEVEPHPCRVGRTGLEQGGEVEDGHERRVMPLRG